MVGGAAALALVAGVYFVAQPANDEAPGVVATLADAAPGTQILAELPTAPFPVPESLAGAAEPPAVSGTASTTPASATPRGLADYAPAIRLTGRLVDPSGAPVPDAEVVHVPSPALVKALDRKRTPFGPDLPWDDFVSTRSDESGRFVLSTWDLPRPEAPPAPPPETLYQTPREPVPALALLHPDFEAQLYTCHAYSKGNLDVGDVVLVPGPSLTGRLVDERGAPVGGVRVGLSFHSNSPAAEPARDQQWVLLDEVIATHSGDDGRFRLGSLWPGGLDLRISASQYVPVEMEVELGGDGHDLGDIVMQRGESIAGVVLDAQGRPLAGATVKARAAELDMTHGATDTAAYELSIVVHSSNVHEVETRTDAQGAFELLTLNQPVYDVLAGAEGLEPGKVADVGVGRSDLVIELQPQAWALVRVRDASSNEPLDGAAATGRRYVIGNTMPEDQAFTKLTVLAGEPAAQAARAALGEQAPGPRGLLVVRGLGQGRNLLVVSAEGYATTSLVLEAALPGARSDSEVALKRQSIVTGRVVDGADAPVAGAAIKVTGPVPDPSSGGARTETADAEGRFRIGALSEGEWTLAARAPGLVRGDPVKVQVAAEAVVENVTLRLEKGGVIRGVVYGERGDPKADVGVELRRIVPPGNAGRAAVASGEAGRFEAASLPGGTYEVVARNGDVVTVELPSGGAAEVELHLHALAVIRGRVTDADGPIAGARVALETRSKAGDEWSSDDRVETDAAGEFRFAPRSAGLYRLAAYANSVRSPPVEFVLDGGQERTVDLQFGSARVRGVVLEAGTQRPIRRARVELTRRDRDPESGLSGADAVVHANEEGRFDAGRLLPGRYDVSASSHLFQRVDRQDVVVPGDEELRFELPPGALLDLAVVASNGQPVPFDLVLVPRDAATDVVLAMAVEREGFASASRTWLANLPPGTTRLQIVQTLRDAAGRPTPRVLAEQIVTLVAGQTLAVEISVAP